MTSSAQLIAIDVGNSSVNLATQDGATLRSHSIAHDSDQWEQAVLDCALGWSGNTPMHWRIASVRDSEARKLIATIGQRIENPLVEVVTHEQVPMPISVDHPSRLGIDRLLGAYAASQRFTLPAVVIDAGSAITVDWVGYDGSFGGGAILPGLALQSRSLAAETEALPQLDWKPLDSVCVPAKNTTDAMLVGILVGVSAAIDELICRYLQSAKLERETVQVVVTGGDATTITPHLRHNHEVLLNLVCRGLLDLPRSIEVLPDADPSPR